MRKFRALVLAAAVAGLTIAGGASAAAAPVTDEVQASTSSWVEPEVIVPTKSSIPKLSVTLIWGWRP